MNTNIVEFRGFKFEYFTDDLLGRNSVGSNKSWEDHILNFVTKYNEKFDLRNIIDVGANFGYHTVFFSKVASHVYSFEPQIQNYKLLQNNIKLNNLNNVTIYNNACGDEITDVNLPIMPSNIKNWNMGDFTPNIIYNGLNYSSTKSIVLDDMNYENIDLIKIDVQGWEKKVLQGLTALITNNKPIMIVEFEEHQLKKTNCSSKELFDYIRNLNYTIFYLEFEYPCDHICVHNDRIDEFKNKFEKYIFPHTENNNLNNNYLNNVNYKIYIKLNSYEIHNKQYEEKGKLEEVLLIHNLKTTESLSQSGGTWDNLYKPGYLHGNWLDSQTKIKDAVDIGCGTGWFVNFLKDHKKFKNVIGIEPSQAAINIAKKLHDNDVTYLCGRAEDMLSNITLNNPTLFTTFIVLSHLTDDIVIKILKEMDKVASKGSVFIFNENVGTEFHMNLWHCRTKKWWEENLPNWTITYDERPRPKLQIHKQGLMGIKK